MKNIAGKYYKLFVRLFLTRSCREVSFPVTGTYRVSPDASQSPGSCCMNNSNELPPPERQWAELGGQSLSDI